MEVPVRVKLVLDKVEIIKVSLHLHRTTEDSQRGRMAAAKYL